MKYKLLCILVLSGTCIASTFASTHKAIQQCLADAAKIESTQTWTWDATWGMMYDKHLTMACYKKYPNSLMTKDEEYTEKENKLYEQYKANPYWCLQPKWGNQYKMTWDYTSNYENVCVNGMADEEHQKIVKEFEPYVKNPSRFYDKLWTKYKENIVKIKQWQTTTTLGEYTTGIMKDINRYKSDFLKDWVSQKTLKDFIQKKANEVDVKSEIQKKQVIKNKALAEKKKQQKELEDTIKPFSQYVNKSYWQYLYNAMKEHYLKPLELINNPSETSWETELDKNAAIINTANDFADYVLINWATNPSVVVKKWQEDTLRDAIMEDVMTKYPNARELYEQVSQK